MQQDQPDEEDGWIFPHTILCAGAPSHNSAKESSELELSQASLQKKTSGEMEWKKGSRGKGLGGSNQGDFGKYKKKTPPFLRMRTREWAQDIEGETQKSREGDTFKGDQKQVRLDIVNEGGERTQYSSLVFSGNKSMVIHLLQIQLLPLTLAFKNLGSTELLPRNAIYSPVTTNNKENPVASRPSIYLFQPSQSFISCQYISFLLFDSESPRRKEYIQLMPTKSPTSNASSSCSFSKSFLFFLLLCFLLLQAHGECK